MSVSINNINIIEMVLTIPICGRLVADLSINTDDASSYKPGTAITITNEDASYKAYISQYTGMFLNTTRFRVYGGSADVTKTIQSKSWNSNIALSQVINYILQQLGITLDSSSDQSILNKRIAGWNIIANDGDIVLKNILNSIPDKVIWQILPNGNMFIGTPSYNTAPSAVYYNVVKEHPETKQYNLNVLGLGLRPGMTINLYDGTTNITNIEYNLFDTDITANVIGEDNS